MRWKLSYSSKLLRDILKNIHRKIQSADLKIDHRLWLLSEYIPRDLSLANDFIDKICFNFATWNAWRLMIYIGTINFKSQW